MKNINELVLNHMEQIKIEDMARQQRQLEIINLYNNFNIKQLELIEVSKISKPILNKYFRGEKVKDSTEIEILKAMQLLIDIGLI